MKVAAGDTFETVAWVYSPSDLALLLSLFESEDILVLPIGRWHASVDPPMTTALGGVELRVHADDAEVARLVLAGLPPVYKERVSFAFALLMILFTLLWFVPPPRQAPAFVLRGAVAAKREPPAL